MDCTVRTVRSMIPSVDERMDKRMDNFATPNASVSALSVLPDILLTSSTARLLGPRFDRVMRPISTVWRVMGSGLV